MLLYISAYMVVSGRPKVEAWMSFPYGPMLQMTGTLSPFLDD